MGSALRTLKDWFQGQKLADSKTLGGQGRLTNELLNSLQNYYGIAIRGNLGNISAMAKAVKQHFTTAIRLMIGHVIIYVSQEKIPGASGRLPKLWAKNSSTKTQYLMPLFTC